MKFKIGDKVKVVKLLKANTCKQPFLGSILTIKSINPDGTYYDNKTHYGIRESYCPFIFYEEELVPMSESKKFTKYDLETGMVVLYKNGKKAFLLNGVLINHSSNGYNFLEYYDKDLNFILKDDSPYRIDKVFRTIATTISEIFDNSNLVLLWERENSTKRMTKEEIEKELGYNIDIV